MARGLLLGKVTVNLRSVRLDGRIVPEDCCFPNWLEIAHGKTVSEVVNKIRVLGSKMKSF
jgi:hypothetical protein